MNPQPVNPRRRAPARGSSVSLWDVFRAALQDYRGKRGYECMDTPETQSDTIKRLSVEEYLEFIRKNVEFWCRMPKSNMTKQQRYTFVDTIQDPNRPCGYLDMKMFIDIYPMEINGNDMEVTLFRRNDYTNLEYDQIAHFTFRKSSVCAQELSDMINTLATFFSH